MEPLKGIGHPLTPGWGPPGPFKGLGWMPLRAPNLIPSASGAYSAGLNFAPRVGPGSCSLGTYWDIFTFAHFPSSLT